MSRAAEKAIMLAESTGRVAMCGALCSSSRVRRGTVMHVAPRRGWTGSRLFIASRLLCGGGGEQFIDGQGHGALIDEALIALVGEAERGAQQLGRDAKIAAALAEEQIEGGLGEDLLFASDGRE